MKENTIELRIHSKRTKSNERKVTKFIMSTFQPKESLSVLYWGRPNWKKA